MNEKESFILYNSFYEPIKALKNEQLGKLLRAIFNYTIKGEITQDNEIMVAFMFIKNQIDRDVEKWEKEKNKRSEAGKKGMASRWGKKNNNGNAVIDSYNNDNTVINDITNITDNVDVYVDVNDNVNVDVNDNVINTNNTNTINNIYDYLQENFGRMLRPAEIEQVEKWEDNEVTRYAIKQAILNGAYTCSYIDSILYNYKMNNITTIQQAQEAEKKFRKQKEEQNKYKGMSYRERERLREEQAIKEWLEEE